MLKTKEDVVNKIHLIISLIVVVPISFIYGFYSDVLTGIHLNTVDEYNIFKAIMGLYLAFSILWVLGVFMTKYLKLALITNVVFMLGLGFGRLIGLMADGMPSVGFVFGTFGELFLGFYGVWVLKSSHHTSANT